MSMFNDISCDKNGNKDECLTSAGVVKVLARRFGIRQWSFIGPGSEKTWYSAENSPLGSWDNIVEEMVICKDDGNLSATEVCSKTDEYGVEMVIRFFSTYESVEIKTDGEPSIVEVSRRVQARRD